MMRMSLKARELGASKTDLKTDLKTDWFSTPEPSTGHLQGQGLYKQAI